MGVMWHPTLQKTRDQGTPDPGFPRKGQGMLSRHSPLPAKPLQNSRSAHPPADTAHCFTRRVLGLCCGAGPREFPAFSTASPARVRDCWVGAAFSGLMFSWSSWSAVCCNVNSAEPASRAAGPGAELPNITAPGGAAGSACGAKQRALRPADQPRYTPAVPARRSSGQPTHPLARSGSCRTEEVAKGGDRHCRTWRAKDAPEMKRAARRSGGCSCSSSIPRLLKWTNEKSRGP